MKKIAVIGIGYWGKNLIREFSKISHVKTCVSLGNSENLKWVEENFPEIKTTLNLNDVLHDSEIEAVVLATPIKTHYRLSKKFLDAGKHVFVEKPICEKYSNAKKLSFLAKKKKLVLYTGYVFNHHQVFQKLKIFLKTDPVQFISLNWFQKSSKENIVYDLISHEISILFDLFGVPKKISKKTHVNIYPNSDFFTLQIGFDNSNALIYTNRINEIKQKIALIKTQKNSFMWLDNSLFKIKNGQFELIFKQTKTPLEIECERFLQIVERTPHDYSNLEHSVLVTKYLEKINHM